MNLVHELPDGDGEISAIRGRVAENMRRTRLARGMSLRDLAAATGLSKALMSQVERGTANPTVTTLAQIASALDLTFAEITRSSVIEPVVFGLTTRMRMLRRSEVGGACRDVLAHGRAQRDVQDGPPLGRIDSLAREHGVAPGGDAGGIGQFDQQIHDFRRDGAFRPVEKEAVERGGKPLEALRIVGKRLAHVLRRRGRAKRPQLGKLGIESGAVHLGHLMLDIVRP